MSLLAIILNTIFPPLPVALKHGIGKTLLISIILTLLAWIPGVIHAFIVNNSCVHCRADFYSNTIT